MKYIIDLKNSEGISSNISVLFNPISTKKEQLNFLIKDIEKEKKLILGNKDILKKYNNLDDDDYLSSVTFIQTQSTINNVFDDIYINSIQDIKSKRINQSKKNLAFFEYLNNQFPKLNLLQYSQEKIVLDFTELVLIRETFDLFEKIEDLKTENKNNSIIVNSLSLEPDFYNYVSEKIEIINNFVSFIEEKLNKNIDKKLVEDFVFAYEKNEKNEENEEIILKEKELLELKSQVRELEAENYKLYHEKLSYFEIKEKKFWEDRAAKRKTFWSSLLDYFK